MRFNPALNDLIDLLAEATLRTLERQNPAGAGSCTNFTSATAGGRSLPVETVSTDRTDGGNGQPSQFKK